jgi:hypothetical protein
LQCDGQVATERRGRRSPCAGRSTPRRQSAIGRGGAGVSGGEEVGASRSPQRPSRRYVAPLRGSRRSPDAPATRGASPSGSRGCG